MTETRCEICWARPARMIVLRRRGDDETRTLVCPECAGDRALLYANADLDLGGIVARLDVEGSHGRSPNQPCELCGTTLAEITDGNPGCCLCYGLFQCEIEKAIREAQGRTRHVGKAPDR